jgi:uncharacterized membrane protein
VSDLSPRQSSRMSRSQREQRAYRLTLATGASGLATVVVLVLAVFGVASFGFAFLLALLTAVLGFVLRRTLGR